MAEPSEGIASHGGAAAGGLTATAARSQSYPAETRCGEATFGHEEKAWGPQASTGQPAIDR